MENLDLKNIGLEEISRSEMESTDGGYWGVALAYAGMVGAAATGAGIIVGAIAVASVVYACYHAE